MAGRAMETKFNSDLNYAKKMQLQLRSLYNDLFNNRYVLIDKGDFYCSDFSERCQKKYKVDTIAQINDFESVFIEEKFRRKNYGDFIIETMSCTKNGHESLGWLYTSMADIINYVVVLENELICYFIRLSDLKSWLNEVMDDYEKKKTNQFNATEFVIIPKSDMLKNVGYKIYKVKYQV